MRRGAFLIIFFVFVSFLFSAGEFYNIGGYKVLRLSGSPYEIGLSYGKLMRKELEKEKKKIKELRALAVGKTFFLFRPIVKTAFNGKIKKKSKMVPVEYIKELKGISLSSNLKLKDLLFLNFFYDFAHPTCSSFVVKTRRGLTFGRNLDYALPKLDLGNKNLIIIFEPTEGNKYIAFSFLGLNTPLTGVNEKGIAIEMNEVPSKGKGYSGFPPLYLMKMVLQYSDNMKEVEDTIKKHKIHIGVNFTVLSISEKKAAIFEVVYNKVKKRDLKNGFLVSTNHFISDLKKELPLPYRASVKRYLRIKELAEKRVLPEYILKDQVDISTGGKNVLRDSVNNDFTVQSILINRNRVIFSAGSNYSPDREKIIFTLRDFFSGRIRGKIYSKGALTYQEKKYSLFLLSSSKMDSIKDKLKVLDDIYFSEKYLEYYVVKAELLKRIKKYEKALEVIKEAENNGFLNDNLLQIRIEILKKKKRKKELKEALLKLKEMKGIEDWFDFQKIKEGWDPYREFLW